MKRFCEIVLTAFAVLMISGCAGTREVASTYSLPTTWPADTDYVEIPEDAIVVSSPSYKATHTIVTDMVHTKLDVKFDWEKEYCFGKAWLTLKPHFYAGDSVTLDAKGFTIHKVELVKGKTSIPLEYRYDTLQLKIQLDKSYSKDETYTVYIDYTAKPGELKAAGAAAIQEERGLYFVNADGKDPNKPRQLWTQGETEASSCWYPCIDKPNQKTTMEISITAEKDHVTLSNGIMISSKQNSDGTHTDTWKLDQPFSPYLTMMAVGPYAVVRDKWKNIEVSYYVDKDYEQYARKIFGNTPEMVEFFSGLLNYPYPWPKYSQAIAHDFVTGAMENVTATTHGAFVQQTARELIDNNHEDVISHELFHQWFGDLVTTESWSNITLNESFATYGEFLWMEYKYGRDEADYSLSNDRNAYMNSPNAAGEPLVRYYYKSVDDVFDVVSYQKGGQILHMLRNHLGDDAFFASLKYYLETHKYSAAEADDLRLACEKISGKDLHWFFNQWYFAPGHPKLNISYEYDEEAEKVHLHVDQTQSATDVTPVYKLPVAIDVYAEGKIKRHFATISERNETLSFPCETKPDLVNFDGDKALLAKRTVTQSEEAWAFQYHHAPRFPDRLEAVQYFAKNSKSNHYDEIMLEALKDPFWNIRQVAVKNIAAGKISSGEQFKSQVMQLASADPKSAVRAAAITQLNAAEKESSLPILENALKDSSYLVITTALALILESDTQKAYQLTTQFENENSEDIAIALFEIYSLAGDTSKNDYFIMWLKKGGSYFRYQALEYYGQYLSRFVDHGEFLHKGIAYMEDLGKNAISWYVRFRSVYSLEAIKGAMDARLKELNTRLNETDAQSQSYNSLLGQISSLTSSLEELNLKIDEIKAAEKDERLISLYNRN